MIPISSQSPTLPSHNSLNYELLSLTAICGEVPCAGSSRLTASESYRKKVVTSLTHDKLLRIFSSHHLRGYRLGVRTKRLLLQQEPERFAFYLSGCSDTNAIKSEVPRRIRLHRIAQTYVTMLNIPVAADSKSCTFVIGQILSNAIKYRKDNLQVEFSARAEKNTVSLFISDNGIGISAADLPRVFDKGFTGENGRRYSKSTGIGLYLSQRLCRKMNISLSISSVPGQGTTVTMVFPTESYLQAAGL